MITLFPENGAKQRSELRFWKQERDVQLHAPFRGWSAAKAFGCVERLDENVDRLIAKFVDLSNGHVEGNIVVTGIGVEYPVQLAPTDVPFIR